MNVAIIQDIISKGGRLAVIVEMVSILNKYNIIPDIISFKLNLSKKAIRKEYNKNVSYNYIQVKPNLLKKFPEVNKLLFHVLINKKLKSYDAVINSNNTFDFINKRINLISYIHYPRKDRVFHKKSIHQDISDNNILSEFILKIDKLTAKALYKISNPRIQKHTIIANSEFTKSATKKVYKNYYKSRIKVIYPSVELFNSKQTEKKKLTACSLGRFHPSKRQLEQIKIAQHLPEIEFNFIGFADKKDSYFIKCLNYINENKIRNVSLLCNLPYPELIKTLQNSSFFIHTMINEPFGIVTVQAISAGVIPIVHNSGGQKEIVPIKDLRYNELEEVKDILKYLFNNTSLIKEFKKKLLPNIRRYSPNNFENQFTEILTEIELL